MLSKRGGDRLKMKLSDLRKRYKLTQRDMAKAIGVSQPLYAMKEGGKRKFTPDEMTRVFIFFKKINTRLNMQDIFF